MTDLHKKFEEYRRRKQHGAHEKKGGFFDFLKRKRPDAHIQVLHPKKDTIHHDTIQSTIRDTHAKRLDVFGFLKKKIHDHNAEPAHAKKEALRHTKPEHKSPKPGLFDFLNKKKPAHLIGSLHPKEDTLHSKYKELFKDEPKPSLFSGKKVDVDHELAKLQKPSRNGLLGFLKKNAKEPFTTSPKVPPIEDESKAEEKLKKKWWSWRKKDDLDKIREDLQKPLELTRKKAAAVAEKAAEVGKKVATRAQESVEETESKLPVEKIKGTPGKTEKPSEKGATGLFGFFSRRSAKKREVQSKDIRILFRKKSKENKRQVTEAERRRHLVDFLEKAGLELDTATLSRRIFYTALGITTLLVLVYIYLNFRSGAWLPGIFIQVTLIWVFGFLLLYGLCWVFFRIYLDLLIFRRKLQVEEVLPDFLQLTSANLRAGMPIDRALWFAVRPRFGVLAKEIEDVAKRTLTGEDLSVALVDFAKKYDSATLLRSVHLLNEGMDAGGDVAELLNRIAINIQEMRGMKKEMAANVTTYVIFITFASLVAAPFLFGLSKSLLEIVQAIATSVGSSGMKRSVGLSINISSDNIKLSDYKIFAYSCLIMSSFFSAVIVTTIRKGNIREGLHLIPIFVAVAVFMFFIASFFLGKLLGGMFTAI
jgi:pilus assembly protein TadC